MCVKSRFDAANSTPADARAHSQKRKLTVSMGERRRRGASARAKSSRAASASGVKLINDDKDSAPDVGDVGEKNAAASAMDKHDGRAGDGGATDGGQPGISDGEADGNEDETVGETFGDERAGDGSATNGVLNTAGGADRMVDEGSGATNGEDKDDNEESGIDKDGGGLPKNNSGEHTTPAEEEAPEFAATNAATASVGSQAIEEASNLVRKNSNDSGDIEVTAVGQNERIQRSVVCVKGRSSSSFRAIALAENAQCHFVAAGNSRLIVERGEIWLSQDSGSIRATPGKSHLLDGEIRITNNGNGDAVVGYETGPFAVAERSIECTPVVKSGDDAGYCCKILEYHGKYFVMDDKGSLSEFDGLESSSYHVKALMNRKLDELEERVVVRRWTFELLNKEDERSATAVFDVSLDADREQILQGIMAFRGACDLTPRIKFLARSQVAES